MSAPATPTDSSSPFSAAGLATLSKSRAPLALLVTGLLVLVGWAIALFVVGADLDQGDVYRIIFVHVPVAWCSFMWVIIGAVNAVLAFARPATAEERDHATLAAMELGTLFALLSLITGSIWGRPTWGVWWDWDPRLTTTLILFLICCAFHLLRAFTPDLRHRRMVSGVTSILAAVNIFIVYYSVNLWRSLHQPQTFVQRGSTASSDIKTVMWVNVLLLVIFSISLYKVRKQGITAEEALRTARESLL